MTAGVELFRRFDAVAETFEVFPSAAHKQFDGEDGPKATVDLGQLFHGPKDMIDACVAAITVREFLAGRGCAVGGRDGLGSIILPRPIEDPIPEVSDWPE